MRLRREAGLGIGTLLGIQLILSLLSITLLLRMGPAIEQILEENVYSEAAVEAMLSSLALARTPQAVPQGFEEALLRAQANLTEEGEKAPLTIIERDQAAAFMGNPQAREQLTHALRELGAVNRASMERRDAQAKALGTAGAWAAAVLGTLTLSLGIAVFRRMRLQLELPIEGLRAATQRVREGNAQARSDPSVGPSEVREIANNLNWILDQHLLSAHACAAQTGSDRAEERRLLLWVLDRDPTPTWVLDQRGALILNNAPAMGLPVPELQAATSTVHAISGTELRLVQEST